MTKTFCMLFLLFLHLRLTNCLKKLRRPSIFEARPLCAKTTPAIAFFLVSEALAEPSAQAAAQATPTAFQPNVPLATASGQGAKGWLPGPACHLAPNLAHKAVASGRRRREAGRGLRSPEGGTTSAHLRLPAKAESPAFLHSASLQNQYECLQR